MAFHIPLLLLNLGYLFLLKRCLSHCLVTDSRFDFTQALGRFLYYLLYLSTCATAVLCLSTGQHLRLWTRILFDLGIGLFICDAMQFGNLLPACFRGIYCLNPCRWRQLFVPVHQTTWCHVRPEYNVQYWDSLKSHTKFSQMGMEHWSSDNWQKKTEILRENLAQCYFVHYKSHMNYPWKDMAPWLKSSYGHSPVTEFTGGLLRWAGTAYTHFAWVIMTLVSKLWYFRNKCGEGCFTSRVYCYLSLIVRKKYGSIIFQQSHNIRGWLCATYYTQMEASIDVSGGQNEDCRTGKCMLHIRKCPEGDR
jgi:hypothetical protein